MTKRPIKDVAASVHQRLLNIAKESGRRFNDLVQHYALERWLFRLSRSAYGERFVLKGALLLVVWKTPVTRPTRDVDLLGRVSNDLDSVRSVIAEILQTPVEDDGLVFDAASVTTDRIAEDADYEGVRAKFVGRLGNTRITMQVDIGFSDVITPGPTRVSYPTILEQPPAQLLAYNRETAIAEKFEAMVKLGDVNTRMKDFFDIWLLAANFEFDGLSLLAAVRATFAQRQTPLEVAPVSFSDEFARNPAKEAQWSAFVRRSLLPHTPAEFSEVVVHVRDFLQPIAQAISENRPLARHWRRGGPWESETGETR
jgi:predicted nucleotidyltransferase component of viral defense system